MEIITTHKNTDFDALASVFASSILYPNAKRILPTSLNPNVRAFLSIHKDIFQYHLPRDIKLQSFSRLVVVDANSWSRLDGMAKLKEQEDLEIYLWDHHKEDGDIQADWACHEFVGSTTTLLVRQLIEEGINISPIHATLFLAGIYEDTGNLTFTSTTSEDARAAGFLLDCKADLNVVKNFLRPVYGPAQKEILFEMLKNGKRFKVNGQNVCINRVNIDGHVPGLSIVVDMYQDVMNVDAAFGIFSEPKKDRCIVIGRSSPGGPDIGYIMQPLGGGGHPNAGSALIKSKSARDVEKWLSDLIEGNQKASVQISDLMSFPVCTISPDASMREAAILLREKGCTGIPVMDSGRLIGVISRRDFSKVRGVSKMELPVKAFMKREVIYIGPETSVVEAARLMVKHDIGRLPVIQDGSLIGIITRSDTMRYFYDLPS